MNRNRVIELAVPIIKHFEGLRTDAYVDSAGVWTIGYGHTAAMGAPIPKRGMSISKQQAEEILKRDIEKTVDVVENIVGPEHISNLTDEQVAALVSFTFNVGGGNFKKSTLLKKIKKGDLRGAAKEFDRWVYAGGKKLRGLVRRRAAERELFESGFEKIDLPFEDEIEEEVYKGVVETVKELDNKTEVDNPKKSRRKKAVVWSALVAIITSLFSFVGYMLGIDVSWITSWLQSILP